jgi:hypothetical protein
MSRNETDGTVYVVDMNDFLEFTLSYSVLQFYPPHTFDYLLSSVDVLLLANNLTVFISPEKGSMNYAVVHKSVVNVISSSLDGSTVTNRQVIYKEPSAVQQNIPMIIQA